MSYPWSARSSTSDRMRNSAEPFFNSPSSCGVLICGTATLYSVSRPVRALDGAAGLPADENADAADIRLALATQRRSTCVVCNAELDQVIGIAFAEELLDPWESLRFEVVDM